MKARLMAVGWLLCEVAIRAQVPAPADVFGFQPGQERKLADYAQMREYYRRLDEASSRIRVVDIGPTAEGRRMMLAIISSEENMKRLNEFRETARALARARISPQEAQRLAAAGRAVVWIDGGMHATEIAHGQMSPELAYRVVSGESEEMRFIRERVILLQVPVMNPDGMDLVVNWFRRHLNTEFERSPLPELYQKYVGHDNNRDWYMITQPETQNVARLLYHEWYPQIVYNHHQTGPFPARIFIPPFAEPMNPDIPPLVARGIDLVGNAMGARFEAEGKTGVISRLGYTTWWNGGMRTAPYFHNMVGILTETSHRWPWVEESDPREFPPAFRDGTSTTVPSAKYPNPWPGGKWGLGDAIEYMLTGSLAVLDVGARHRDQWLQNIYRMGREAIEKGGSREPYAYIIPVRQHDPAAAARLVETLRRGGIEIHRAGEDFQIEGRELEAGSWIIYAAQAFRPHLVNLMETQRYPDRRLYPGGPPRRPYDITGWTLPLQMGVEVVSAREAFQAEAEASGSIELEVPPAPDPSSRVYLIERRWSSSYRLVNGLLSRGREVRVLTGELRLADTTYPAGTFVVERGALEELAGLSAASRTPVIGLEGMIEEPLLRLSRTRLGVYKSWVANMDAGWTRWLLEQYEFPYRNLSDQDIRAGRLRDHFDVIVLPSQGADSMRAGHPPGRMPPPYVGGMGLEGFYELKNFVAEGGVLVTLDASSELPVNHFDLGVRDALDGVSSSDFFCPGSLVRVRVDVKDPIGWGMQPECAAFFSHSQAFRLGYPSSSRDDSSSPVPEHVHGLASYATEDVLMSGWILGEKRIQGRQAVVRAELGQGQVVMLGFRSQFRSQSQGTFKLLFNAVYLGGMERP